MKKVAPMALLLTAILAGAFSVQANEAADDSRPRSAVMQQLHENEIQAWREYISRFQDYQLDIRYDVLFYHLDITVSLGTRYIEGSVLCQLESNDPGLGSVTLNLEESLAVDSITGDVSTYLEFGDSLRVDLDRTYASGEQAAFTIYYQGVPQTVSGTKGLRYETHAGGEPIIASLSTPYLAHYWWPCKDGPGDKPDSVYVDVSIRDTTVNGRQVIAVSNGLLENTSVANGVRTFEWRHRYPIVTYYVMIAISNFEEFQDYYDDGESAFPLVYYSFPEDLVDNQAGVTRMSEAIALYTGKFGVYPFREEKYGLTQVGFYGGIENQTNTIQAEFTPSWWEVTVHELAHQWFGDFITCADWHHGWLNEGFATYCEALWREYDEGPAGYKDHMQLLEYFDGGTLYLDDVSNPMQVFITIIYDKGAWALHMLRGVLGDDVFFNCLAAYASDPTFAYGHATTEQFQTVCETVSGADLDYFFDQWIYDAYYPEYHWGFGQDPANYEGSLTIVQEQSVLGRRPVFTMPIRMRFSFESGGDTVITVFNDQQFHVIPLTFDEPVTTVDFDYGDWILKEVYNDIVPEVTESSRLYVDTEGNANNHPDPGESNVELVLEVTNTGADAFALTVDATCLQPEVTFDQAHSSFGNVLRDQTVSNAADPLRFSVAAGIDPTLVHFVLSYSANNGMYSLIDTLRVNIGEPQVLLVDDDLATPWNLEQYYLRVFDSLRTPFRVWDKAAEATPTADSLISYPVTIWFTGDHRTEVLSADDVDSLRTLLDNGGRLLITGQDIAEDLDNDADSTFLHDYFAIEFSSGSPLLLADGVDGDPISNGHSVALGGSGGAANQSSPDILLPRHADAIPIYTYYASSDVAGIRIARADYRAVFLGFGCEAIPANYPPFTNRADVIYRILAWLLEWGPDYIPGDVNQDDNVDPLDVSYLVNYVYKGAGPLPNVNAGDVNADCKINPLDVAYMVNFVYKGLGELLPGCVQ